MNISTSSMSQPLINEGEGHGSDKPTSPSSGSREEVKEELRPGPQHGAPQVEEQAQETPGVHLVLGQPVHVDADRGYPINIGEVMVPVWSLGEPDARILSTYSLAQGIKILAFLDAMILIINVVSFSVSETVWGAFMIAFFWGPVAGYLGAQYYNPYLACLYLTYYFARVAVDVFVVVEFHVWWFIIAVICDVFLAYYVGMFVRFLLLATPPELEFLKHPQHARYVIAPLAHPYFIFF